jgi:hypothetical protein
MRELGGAHLLLHGIWAFKVDGAGGRTDLVLGTPIKDMREVVGSADALVLTEWKIAKPENVETKITEAREQTKKYSEGVLGGIELDQYRYLVMVSSN